MSTKNAYMFKVIITNNTTHAEIDIKDFKHMVERDLIENGKNNSIKLSYEDSEPVMLDVIENTEDYLFARLSKKKANNKMQKRDYTSYEIFDVLPPEETGNSGVELFTYCILGYKHGILTLAKSSGAPQENAFELLFSRYHHSLEWHTEPIMNNNLIKELIDGKAPEINRIEVDIPRPEAQILTELFGFGDRETIDTVSRGASRLVFEVKPEFRGSLTVGKEGVEKLVRLFRDNKRKYNSVILSGKSDTGTRQRRYDLYEEYFKYPIDIIEYRTSNGKKIEVDKENILQQYKTSMIDIYEQYKEVILAVSNR